MLRESVRVTKRGGTVSAIICFCHSGNLPDYHGRFLPEDNYREDHLSLQLTRAFRKSIRSRILGFDHRVLSADVFPEFTRLGLVDVEINGHLGAVSPADSRFQPDEAARYSLARNRADLKTLVRLRDQHGDELERDGFGPEMFAELIDLKRNRLSFLEADPVRVLDLAEVFTQPVLIMRGTRPVDG